MACTLGTLFESLVPAYEASWWAGVAWGLWAQHLVLRGRPQASVAQRNTELGAVAPEPEYVQVCEMIQFLYSCSWSEMGFVIFHPNGDSTLVIIRPAH